MASKQDCPLSVEDQTRLPEPIKINWQWGSAKAFVHTGCESLYESPEPETNPFNGCGLEAMSYAETVVKIETEEQAIEIYNECVYSARMKGDIGSGQAEAAVNRSLRRVRSEIENALTDMGYDIEKETLGTIEGLV